MTDSGPTLFSADQGGSPIEQSAGAYLQVHRGGDPAGTGTQSTSTWEATLRAVRKDLSEAMGAKNISFLMGSGCSSLLSGGVQLGVPTMGPLAKEFTSTLGKRGDNLFVTRSQREFLKNSLGVDLTKEDYQRNLERLTEVLECHRFSLAASALPRHAKAHETTKLILAKLQRFLYARCTTGPFSADDQTVSKLYERFYRKLVYRDRSLPRPWVFTTNYDLFNETAMDRLGLPFCNGFSGAIERRFNPAVFRYALAEQLDISSRKWSAVDGFVYLCKLHGSISWTEDGHGLYPIREVQRPVENQRMMIFPSPAKQNASLASPYADLFREFHSRIVREQSVLFSIGYAFGDEHVNSIIYQALTIPTFRLVIFADPTSGGEIQKLRELADPRIWIIGGRRPDGTPAHHFGTFVDDLMPEPANDRVDAAITRVVEKLIGETRESRDKE